MKKILFTVLFLSISSVFAENAKNFTYLGHPVKPTCVALFNSTVENYPYVESINLRQCQYGRSFLQATHHDKKGYYFFYKNDRNMKAGAYYYKLVGKTTNGIYVLHTYNSHGANGMFDMLLFMRMMYRKLIVYDHNSKPAMKEPAAFLTLKSYVMGGDRCTNGIKLAKVTGNKVYVWQYPKKNSVDQCQGAKKFVIDLARLNKQQ